jgi:hypothetical protein
MKQLYVFSPDVSGEEILRKLRAGAEDFACYDKSCAPPPVGEGGSSKGAGRSSKLAGRITEILKERPGATLNPRAGYKDVTTGFVVSERPDLSYEKPLAELSAGDIDGWLADNRETLAKAGNNVGVWHDQSTGQVWLDVVRVYPATGKGRRDAVASGIKHNQIAIYDLDNDDEITIGGTGKAISAALTAACRSKACAPPPVGTGGSAEQGAGSGEIAIYEVGGAVRDRLMGIESDDVDFAVTADSYDAMKRHLESEGFRIFQESPEFVTIKAQPPEGHPLRERTMSADFVLARRDGPSSDGRRPDYTEPGSLEDDLARRDFTVNAIAEAPDGRLIDPHGGQQDIESKTLRFVGDPMTRIKEDGLRALRGFRFMVTKDLTPDPATWDAITSPEAAQMLQSVSKERVSAELTKMLDYDTRSAVRMLGSLPEATLDAIFRDGVRLAPTMKKQRGRSLNASALVAACRSKECAPPPVGTGGSVPASSGGATGKLAAALSRTRNVTNRPVGRSSYKPGRKKVGDATPLTDPDRFSTEDLRAELRHQRKRNWRTWQTNPEVRDRIMRLTNEISRRGRESRSYRRGMAASLVAACRSKECAPPPVGVGGSTESEGSGRQLRDPSAAIGRRGDIYRNLHHGSDDSPVWSVRSGGKVIGHASQVLIASPKFVVGQKARERVLREKSKNVHAFVRGEVSAVNDDVPDVNDGSWRVAKYNPYKYSTFVDSETDEPVTSASEAVLASSTSVYYRP